MRILVAGDSIGVGVGASASSTSIAGLLGAYFPTATIRNISVSGATISNIHESLQQVTEDFDLIYIHGGANDVVGRTPYPQFRSDIQKLYQLAQRKGKRVVHLASGSVGFAPFFPQPLDWYFTRRTITTYEIVSAKAVENNVEFVSLYQPRDHDPFVRDPKRYFAPDLFHPSDAGYALWFGVLTEALERNKSEDNMHVGERE
jgi:lysophospholipase L1-like esterase